MRILNHFSKFGGNILQYQRKLHFIHDSKKKKKKKQNRIFQEVENNCQSLHPQTIITYSKPSLQEYVKSKL